MNDIADLAPWQARRAPVGAARGFRPDRRDPNAPVIALIGEATAACYGDPNPDRWFPDRHARSAEIRELHSVCISCPIYESCLQYALKNEVVGYWAGTTSGERDRLRQRLRITPEKVTYREWVRDV